VVAVVGFIDLRAGREVWGSSVVRWMGLMGRTELDIFVLESCVGFVLLLGEWRAWGLFFGGACWRCMLEVHVGGGVTWWDLWDSMQVLGTRSHSHLTEDAVQSYKPNMNISK
jgi:hypothetical protein